MVHVLGGKVNPAKTREYGHAEVEIVAESELFSGLPKSLEVWMSHGDEAVELPSGFSLIAQSPNSLAAIQNPAQKMFAVQFHAEVRHTRVGTEILRNFVLNIGHSQPHCTPPHFLEPRV